MLYGVIYKETGQLFSLGTILSDPMPEEFEAIEMSQVDYAKASSTLYLWNPETLQFDEVEPSE